MSKNRADTYTHTHRMITVTLCLVPTLGIMIENQDTSIGICKSSLLQMNGSVQKWPNPHAYEKLFYCIILLN